MVTFFLLMSIVAVILLYKVAVFVYNYYIRFSHIPGYTCIPFFGTLVFLRQTQEGRVNWLLSQINKFRDGLFLLWTGSQPKVYIFKPEMVKVILSSTVFVNKSPMYDYFHEWMGTGLIFSDGKQWLRDRKLLSPTLHFNILDRFGVIMSEKTEVMIKNLEKMLARTPEKTIDIVPVINNLTLDIAFDTLMGINMHTRETRSNYIDCTRRMFGMILQRIHVPWYQIDWLYNLTHAGREYKQTLHKLHEFTRTVIEKKQLARRAENDVSQDNYNTFDMIIAKSKRKTLLELLLDLNENENNLLSNDELRGQVDTFMFASYDTTSTTLVWVLFCLGNNLEHQEKVHKEIDEVFQDSQDPATVKQLSQLKYLDRVIKESMRLYPVVPFIARRAMEDVNLGGYTIPKDTMLIISILLLHRDPTVWPDPFKFDPDRFLPKNIRHPYAFVPFSAGPRNCIGQRFALLVEKIVLTAILRKWRIKSEEKELTMYNNSILRPYRGDVRMQFSPKKIE